MVRASEKDGGVMVKSRVPWMFGIISMIGAIAGGQSAQTPPNPAFEVASVKQNKSGQNFGNMGGPPGQFTANNAPLRQLILYAYQIQSFELEGRPSWITSDRFDIAATAEGNARQGEPGGPPGLIRLMVRTLLADRFKMAIHKETKELPIYALVMARTDGRLGPRLLRSNTDCAALGAALAEAGAPRLNHRRADVRYAASPEQAQEVWRPAASRSRRLPRRYRR